VVKNNLFKVLLSRDIKYLIVSFLNKDFVYFRVVFNVKTCTFSLLATDKNKYRHEKEEFISPRRTNLVQKHWEYYVKFKIF
jgi:hypothetical protein